MAAQTCMRWAWCSMKSSSASCLINGTDALSTALAHLTEPLPELPLHHGRYQDVLRKLLAKDPNERFPDAAALLLALDQLPTESPDATQVRPLPIPLSFDLAGITPQSHRDPDRQAATGAPAGGAANPRGTRCPSSAVGRCWRWPPWRWRLPWP